MPQILLHILQTIEWDIHMQFTVKNNKKKVQQKMNERKEKRNLTEIQSLIVFVLLLFCLVAFLCMHRMSCVLW